MAITEISVADSITCGYYYIVRGEYARVRSIVRCLMHSSRSKANRRCRCFAVLLMEDQLEFYDADSSGKKKNTYYANARVIALSDFSQKSRYPRHDGLRKLIIVVRMLEDLKKLCPGDSIKAPESSHLTIRLCASKRAELIHQTNIISLMESSC